MLLGVLLGNRMGEDTLRTCFGVLVLLLAVRELWLGFQALRREGWRLTARQNKKDADDEPKEARRGAAPSACACGAD